MKNEKKNGIITSVIILIIVLIILGILLVINKKKDNNQDNNSISLSLICKETTYDKLEILSMENKNEKITAMGGDEKIGYNVTTTVTKKNSYNTPETNELYTIDALNNLYVLYKNKLYYTSDKEIISKYCENQEVDNSKNLVCDYSKFNSNTIKELRIIDLNLNLKSIGTYGNSGSGAPTLYLITTNGKVINLPNASSNNYNSCGIMYDDSNYPIDKIFNMKLYDGINYSILLKDGTLITRYVDRENPIKLED